MSLSCWKELGGGGGGRRLREEGGRGGGGAQEGERKRRWGRFCSNRKPAIVSAEPQSCSLSPFLFGFYLMFFFVLFERFHDVLVENSALNNLSLRPGRDCQALATLATPLAITPTNGVKHHPHRWRRTHARTHARTHMGAAQEDRRIINRWE